MIVYSNDDITLDIVNVENIDLLSIIAHSCYFSTKILQLSKASMVILRHTARKRVVPRRMERHCARNLKVRFCLRVARIEDNVLHFLVLRLSDVLCIIFISL